MTYKDERREQCISILNKQGLRLTFFSSQHLRIHLDSKRYIDYWPSTGKYVTRRKGGGAERWGSGIQDLLIVLGVGGGNRDTVRAILALEEW